MVIKNRLRNIKNVKILVRIYDERNDVFYSLYNLKYETSYVMIIEAYKNIKNMYRW